MMGVNVNNNNITEQIFNKTTELEREIKNVFTIKIYTFPIGNVFFNNTKILASFNIDAVPNKIITLSFSGCVLENNNMNISLKINGSIVAKRVFFGKNLNFTYNFLSFSNNNIEIIGNSLQDVNLTNVSVSFNGEINVKDLPKLRIFNNASNYYAVTNVNGNKYLSTYSSFNDLKTNFQMSQTEKLITYCDYNFKTVLGYGKGDFYALKLLSNGSLFLTDETTDVLISEGVNDACLCTIDNLTYSFLIVYKKGSSVHCKFASITTVGAELNISISNIKAAKLISIIRMNGSTTTMPHFILSTNNKLYLVVCESLTAPNSVMFNSYPLFLDNGTNCNAYINNKNLKVFVNTDNKLKMLNFTIAERRIKRVAQKVLPNAIAGFLNDNNSNCYYYDNCFSEE